MMIDDYILDEGYFEDRDAKLLNLSTYFGGAIGNTDLNNWKNVDKLHETFTKLAEKEEIVTICYN